MRSAPPTPAAWEGRPHVESQPGTLRDFDYTTIGDVILHIRYTARDGGQQLAEQATKELVRNLARATASQTSSTTAISQGLFCLRYNFPTEWAAFVNSASGTTPPPFTATLSMQMFPCTVQIAKKLTIDAVTLHAGGTTPSTADDIYSSNPSSVDIGALTTGLNTATGATRQQATLTLVMTRESWGQPRTYKTNRCFFSSSTASPF